MSYESPDDPSIHVVTGFLYREGSFTGWVVRADVDVTGSPAIVRLEIIREDRPGAVANRWSSPLEHAPLTAALLRELNLTALTASINKLLQHLHSIGRISRPAAL